MGINDCEPVRRDIRFGRILRDPLLLPVFYMNLPEGVLRERLRMAFAKATAPLHSCHVPSAVVSDDEVFSDEIP